jgi:hypothetical protein
MSSGAPREDGTAIRYPSTSLLCISTNDVYPKDRDGFILEGPNPADAQLGQQRTLMAGYVKRIALTECNIEWNVPNVNKLNNTLTFRTVDQNAENPVDIRIVIPGPQFLTAPQLMFLLENELNSNATIISRFGPNTIRVSLGTQTDNFISTDSNFLPNPVFGVTEEFSIPLSFRIEILDDLNPSVPTTRGFMAFLPFSIQTTLPSPTGQPLVDDLTRMMGFTATLIKGQPVFWTTYVGSYASMQYTPYVDVCSNTFTKNQTIQDASSTPTSVGAKLARIYLSNQTIVPRVISATYDLSGVLIDSEDSSLGCHGATFRREFTFPKQIEWNTRQGIATFDLRLVDSKGNTLPIEYHTVEIETVPGDRTKNITLESEQAAFDFTLQISEV